MVYLQLFWSFVKIGLFGFGGGYAIIPLIQHEMERNGWMTETEFTDIIAISQMTPGAIGINCATYVGYTTSGSILGAALAVFAICLPSFIIMLTLCKLFFKYQQNTYINSAFVVLRPVIVGLLATVALLLMNTQNFIDYKSVIIFGGVLMGYFFFKLHPILLIVLAGLAGLMLY